MMKSAQDKSIWKKVQSRSKNKKKTQLALLVLVLITTVVILGQAMRLSQGLLRSLPADQAGEKHYWSGQSNINLVVMGKTVSILSFDPKNSQIVIIEISPETYIDVSGGFGSWQLRAIYSLGQAEATPKGPKLLKQSLETFLAIPIDGFIYLENSPQQSAQQFVENLRKSPLALGQYLGKFQTDLTPIELIRLSHGLLRVRFDKIYAFNLENEELLERNILADGTKALIGDPIKIDGFVLAHLTDSLIVEEQITVAVYNGTNYPGLAQRAARMISNIGGNVIILTNTEVKNIEKSFVIADGSSYTRKRLEQIFAPNCQENLSCVMIDPNTLNSRAQINLFLGKDYYEKY